MGGAYVGRRSGHGDGEVGIGRGLQGRWRGVVGDHTGEVHDVGAFTERGLSEGAHADGRSENVEGRQDQKTRREAMHVCIRSARRWGMHGSKARNYNEGHQIHSSPTGGSADTNRVADQTRLAVDEYNDDNNNNNNMIPCYRCLGAGGNQKQGRGEDGSDCVEISVSLIHTMY